MTEIVLDASSWQNTIDFYNAYCLATEAPKWFGRNLDPFRDSLRGGICKITPEKIRVQYMTKRVKERVGSEFMKSVEEICQEEDVGFVYE